MRRRWRRWYTESQHRPPTAMGSRSGHTVGGPHDAQTARPDLRSRPGRIAAGAVGAAGPGTTAARRLSTARARTTSRTSSHDKCQGLKFEVKGRVEGLRDHLQRARVRRAGVPGTTTATGTARCGRTRRTAGRPSCPASPASARSRPARQGRRLALPRRDLRGAVRREERQGKHRSRRVGRAGAGHDVRHARRQPARRRAVGRDGHQQLAATGRRGSRTSTSATSCDASSAEPSQVSSSASSRRRTTTSPASPIATR